MKRNLASLIALATLAACGGGGGGGGETPAPQTNASAQTGAATEQNNTGNSTTTPDANAGSSTTNTAQNNSQEGNQNNQGETSSSSIRTRLDACPFANASLSPNANNCLAGTYKGTDLHTKAACSVSIQANGPVTASAGSLRIQLQRPFSASNYTKARYTPIAGTSTVGYMLVWSSGQSNVTADSIIDRNVMFNFNSGLDNQLMIEVTDRQASKSISCNIPL